MYCKVYPVKNIEDKPSNFNRLKASKREKSKSETTFKEILNKKIKEVI